MLWNGNDKKICTFTTYPPTMHPLINPTTSPFPSLHFSLFCHHGFPWYHPGVQLLVNGRVRFIFTTMHKSGWGDSNHSCITKEYRAVFTGTEGSGWASAWKIPPEDQTTTLKIICRENSITSADISATCLKSPEAQCSANTFVFFHSLRLHSCWSQMKFDNTDKLSNTRSIGHSQQPSLIIKDVPSLSISTPQGRSRESVSMGTG